MITASLTKDEGTPVIAVQMNYEKSFAFIEFRSVDDATSGMLLDGITLHGQSLKVRRPKDYQPLPGEQVLHSPTADAQASPPTGALSGYVAHPSEGWVRAGTVPVNPQHIPGIVSTNVPDSPNKIFIGGLPSYLNEEQVKDLLFTFGQLKSFNLVKDSVTGNSKGYAFFEYLDESVTDKACAGLNGMKIQDKTLLVQRANIGAKNITVAAVTGVANPTAANFLNLSVPTTALLSQLPGMGGLGAQTATNTLILLNLATPEELVEENFYNDLVRDIKEECLKYGHVVNMRVPRPLKNSGDSDPILDVGKVFVEFQTTEESKSAQLALAGRKYNSRTVVTAFCISHGWKSSWADGIPSQYTD
eukprot:TRINITY_DN327_c0_g1_i5.p1 TRINITY_DN327_c0_g1~~TRINITY_DN327_c0_g1_i5.p1  ORF type:complete len:360 (-),score=71.67 TRINITY_DN327_c0_g1_i5:3-1082(-)